jgi:colanic acid biosynthesis glycosyl transferase WcaI
VAKTDPPLIVVVAAIVAKIRGAKLINWIQDLFPEVAGALGAGGIMEVEGLLRSARNWSIRTAYKNVVIVDGMATKLTEEGVQPNTIQVIHNWTDGYVIQPVDHGKNDLRREWSFGGVFVVAYSRNIGRVHGSGTILESSVEP